jgi:hypothetical protein
MHPVDEAIPASSLTESQREEVIAQLEAVLSHSLFRQSKRYPAFLRYVVESTIKGSEEPLKERTIGVEVFGRLPHYDTSLDPTVRLTAAEVRKRLALYYQQPEHAQQLHIDLHLGSYVPTFSWPAGAAQPDDPLQSITHVPALEAPSPIESPVGSAAKPLLRSMGWCFAGSVVCLAIALLIAHPFSRTSNAGQVWEPLLHDPNPVSLVLPDLSKTDFLPQARETADTSVLSHIRENRLVDFNDSVALARLSGMLGGWNKPYRVLLSSETTFEDLQSGPGILIGAVDNPWTMRFLEPLPYSIARHGDTLTFEILGRKPGMQHGWSIDLSQPFEKLQQDYGILARETDTMTGRPALILAGLGQNGTLAGLRLLSDPAVEAEMTAAASKGWSGRNFEIVFRTQIIADKFGPPVIVAREYW